MRGIQPVAMISIAVVVAGITGLLYAVDSTSKPTSQPADAASKPASQPTSAPASAPASQPAKPQVVIETNMGRIVLELNIDKAPDTVANFLQYVDEKFYDGTIFHRVIEKFMIQGGGIAVGGTPKRPAHKPVHNESRNAGSNRRGTIAMARTGHPDSATCQFFINTVDNQRLDFPSYGGYTMFGRVIEGMDVVDRIAAVEVERSDLSEAQPLQDVIITSIRCK